MTAETANQAFKRHWERDLLMVRRMFSNPAAPASGAAGKAVRRAGELEFGFTFERIRFIARLRMNGEDAHIRLRGDLGPLPYSAQAEEARRRLRRIMAETATPHLGLRLSRRQHVVLQGSGDLGRPATLLSVISAVVGMLLRCRPFLGPAVDLLQGPERSRFRAEASG